MRVSSWQRAVTVFGPPPADVAPPGWYPYTPALVFDAALTARARRSSRRMLGLDGVEVEAFLAGTVAVPIAGGPVSLTVYRMPVPGTEESDLVVFFRDETNGRGTYPPGRFLALLPIGGNQYRVDFNRARNPFCAYNGVFPCPLPWPGNAIPAPVEAGERYAGR